MTMTETHTETEGEDTLIWKRPVQFRQGCESPTIVSDENHHKHDHQDAVWMWFADLHFSVWTDPKVSSEIMSSAWTLHARIGWWNIHQTHRAVEERQNSGWEVISGERRNNLSLIPATITAQKLQPFVIWSAVCPKVWEYSEIYHICC